jgi:hypothetical protein
VVAGISDTLTVLARGSVLAEGPYAEVAANPLVIEAYMGTEASGLASIPASDDHPPGPLPGEGGDQGSLLSNSGGGR